MKTVVFILIMILAGMVFAQVDSTNSLLQKDTTIKIAWRQEIFDSKLNQTINSLILNESYFSAVTEAEKAILGYIATFVGNECRQDEDNVKCKILDALNLSYQCSELNKEFFMKWFTDEPGILNEIESCRSLLSSLSSTSTFDKITVTAKGEAITVKYSAITADIKKNKLEKWTEELTFSVAGDKLKLMKRSKKVKK